MKTLKLKRWERLALGQYLSEIPYNKSFNEIIEMVRDDHEDIQIWEPFDGGDPSNVVNLICAEKRELKQEFAAAIKEALAKRNRKSKSAL